MVHNAVMNDPQPIDPRRRIRELLAIPERDRTDEQWDELNELEIQTAPGNRDTGNRDTGRQPDRYQEKRPGGNGPAHRTERGNQPARPEIRQQAGGAKPEGRLPKRQHRRQRRPTGEKVERPAGSGNEGGNSGES